MRRAATLALLLASSAHAFSIGTGFSAGCHERLTAAVYGSYLADLPFRGQQRPRGAAWEKLSDEFSREFGLEAYDDEKRAIIVSLLLGVRAPDTRSHSLFDLSRTRDIHLDPLDQRAHALRAPGDDGPDGDGAALEATRQHIEGRLDEALRHLDDTLTVRLTLDFYGEVDVEVLRGPFHLGEALHALQDSFAHSLRSPDFRQVHHVLNFVDALSSTHDEARDGLRHSSGLDECDGVGAPAAQAARVASLEWIEALIDEGPAGANRVLAGWLDRREGCTIDNGYCGNAFLSAARGNATRSPLSCAASPGAPLLLLAAVLMRRRRRLPWPLVVPVLGVIACGPAPQTPVTPACAPVAACAGSLEGTWYIEASCLLPEDGPAPTCEVPQTSRDLTVAGFVRFEGERGEGALRGRLREVLARPRACSASGRCDDVEGLPGGYSCVAQGAQCACARGGVGAEAGTFSVQVLGGGELSIDGQSALACAAGDRLRLQLASRPTPLVLSLRRFP